ncbi:amidohydrolase family protein [Sphingomonas sp. CL5.1]|uniref:amidohydrolase family protein n=1 Tax=Sphingomonas sp. CL5.1 TaxID=2653203 RepID=UPI001581CDFE|nr:amidohydrolase family protein [Sphingomonas sp. CL5.1]QKS00943.1 amidohydrolase family protein [Sphingomonas sp. CL5.1]
MIRAFLLSAAALIALPAGAQTVAVTDATVALGDGSAPIRNGTVVFRDGRIVSAGANVAVPAGAEVVDGHGKWVSPGLIAGFTDLGLQDAGGIEESNDTAARGSPFAAAIDVSTAINPAGAKIGNERLAGITRALVAPDAGGSIFAGQGAVIDLGDDADAVTRPRAFQYVELGEHGAREAGGSRPAAYALFRDALAQAQDYRGNPAAFGGRERASLLKRGDAEALLKVIDGQMPLVVHVERASDIRTVLGLVRDYPRLKLVLTGASEGWLVAREIAAAKVPVVAAALADLPESFEALAATESNVGRMRAAGVQVALSAAGASGGERNIRQYAGNLVAITRIPGATGLDWGQALASITSGPAAALGLEGELGSLKPGRRADVVLWDGDPLEIESQPVAIWIDGRPQPMRSRQTELRDRYLTPTEGVLPKAYDRR